MNTFQYSSVSQKRICTRETQKSVQDIEEDTLGLIVPQLLFRVL